MCESDKAPDFSPEFAEIIQKWNAIEKRLKEAEQICGDAVVAAINELRYAGRQFIDAMMIYTKGHLSPKDIDDINTHLKHVRYNLMNADHDCTDAVFSRARKENYGRLWPRSNP
jgi:hypothetical protein